MENDYELQTTPGWYTKKQLIKLKTQTLSVCDTRFACFYYQAPQISGFASVLYSTVVRY